MGRSDCLVDGWGIDRYAITPSTVGLYIENGIGIMA